MNLVGKIEVEYCANMDAAALCGIFQQACADRELGSDPPWRRRDIVSELLQVGQTLSLLPQRSSMRRDKTLII